MSKPNDRADSDRNLLFGVLALQVNFINRDELVAGMQAWAYAKSKSLGQILLEAGQLNAGQVQVLEALVVQHLQANGADAERSLAALPEASIVRSTLATCNGDILSASRMPAAARSLNGSTRPHNGVAAARGRYRRLRPHARGGLGEVFVAEDTELHREVALKEIKSEHADKPDSRGRFVLEAEITGGLEHPGIVPVYGLGSCENGRPYYAMRFIRGDSMKQAIERFHTADQPGRDPGERTVAFRQLLRHFVDVCNTVAYAHSRGVLHRDLKPSNVMLGKFGETLVVDWGLAKAGHKDSQHVNGEFAAGNDDTTLHPASGSSVEKTQAGATLGTAHFMSPEQAEGRLTQLGPASDIFSLGATLYVLLTGNRPFESQDDSDVMARVRNGRFTPPAEAKPGTPPALNAICLKAMAPKPAGRHATALDLADDVERWLADEPVAAFAEPISMRLGRWGRRHRTALVGAAAILVTAVIALSISTGLIWAEQQKAAEQKRLAENRLIQVEAEQKNTAEQTKIAEQNYVLARDVGFNSIDLIEATQVELASNPAWQAKRKDILVTAVRACQRFLEQEPDDLALQAKAAKVYRYTANFHRLENNNAAAELLFRDSIQLQEKLLKKIADEPMRWDELAATVRDQANLLASEGKLDKPAENYTRAIDIVTKLEKVHGDHPAYDRSIAAAQLEFASVQMARGKTEASKELGQSAADRFGKLLHVPVDQRHGYDRLLLAAALTRVAIVERETDPTKARDTHKVAVNIFKEMLQEKPANVVEADILHYQALCRVEQALTLARVPEKRADAESILSSARLQWQKLSAKYPNVPSYLSAGAGASLLLGQLQADDKRYGDAEGDLKTACQLLEPLVKQFPQMPRYHAELGRAYAGLGRLARINKDAKGAADYFDRADAELRRAVELSPADVQLRKSRDELRAE